MTKFDITEINKAIKLSYDHQRGLEKELHKSIVKYQEDHLYNFENFEVDAVLLDLLLMRQESFIRQKFGIICENIKA